MSKIFVLLKWEFSAPQFASLVDKIFFYTFCIFSQKHFPTIWRQPQNSEERNKFEYYLSLLSPRHNATDCSVQTNQNTNHWLQLNKRNDRLLSPYIGCFSFRYKKVAISCNFPSCIVDWNSNFTVMRRGRRSIGSQRWAWQKRLMIALKIFIFDPKLIQNGRFPVSNYVCLKEYYLKSYNFAGGQLTSASVPRLHWWQL